MDLTWPELHTFTKNIKSKYKCLDIKVILDDSDTFSDTFSDIFSDTFSDDDLNIDLNTSLNSNLNANSNTDLNADLDTNLNTNLNSINYKPDKNNHIEQSKLECANELYGKFIFKK